MSSPQEPDDEFWPDPPEEPTERELGIAEMTGLLESVPGRSDRGDIIWALIQAFDKFERLRRPGDEPFVLAARERDRLVEASASARMRIDMAFDTENVWSAIDDGLRAFQVLAVHFAKPRERRRLPADRYDDLIAHLRLAHNAVRDAELRAAIAERARIRSLSSVEFAERESASKW